MERYIDMEKVSDGKRYTANDLVKADCGGCTGCSVCCRGMGSSIVLDPLDIFRLCTGLSMSFEELIAGPIELNVVDSLILPNLKMNGEREACVFLNSSERCSIHEFRPGICRMFPLGRIYEDHSFRYFIQVHECPKENKAKIKVKKWLDTPDWKTYEKFICDWHYYLKSLQQQIEKEPDRMKKTSMMVLEQFYVKDYDLKGGFYEQFYERLNDLSKN